LSARWVPAVAALAVTLALPASAAAAPQFAWASPQPAPQAVPAPAPFLVFGRFASGETLQRFYFTLQAGAEETISVLVPAGDPRVEITVLAPDGGEFSLPYAQPAPLLWFGQIPLREVVSYPYPVEDGTGIYTVVAQPGWGRAEPYAIAGNWTGTDPLGPPSAAALLEAPVTWLRTLLWLWG